MTDSTKYTPDHASGVNQKAVQAMQDFLEALGLDLTALLRCQNKRSDVRYGL